MPLQTTSGAASYDAFGGGVPVEPVYIEQIFSTYLYTGNSSTQTITNDIDLDGEGGLVWLKARSSAFESCLFDTVRGATKRLQSSNTDAETVVAASLTAFTSSGFSLSTNGTVNNSGTTFASWTFRKQPKFFDVVAYTGTGSNTTIIHDLGSVPGCIIVKRTDTTGDWQVYHRANTANPETDYLVLNTTAATADSDTRWNDTLPTSTVFSLGTDATVNASGGTYVAYIFAHDAGGFGLTGTDNVISCGTFTAGASGFAAVTLGYEPQWILFKKTDGAQNWYIWDTMRGMALTSSVSLSPNLSGAELNWGASSYVFPTATGFQGTGDFFGNGSTVIYIAIRRGPMKVPTSGTEVFTPTLATFSGTTVTNTGFVVDMVINKPGVATTDTNYVLDRLRGSNNGAGQATLRSTLTSAEVASSGRVALTGSVTIQNGFLQQDTTANNIVWSFRRAPGFFDVVCYTGTNTDNTLKPHNLGVKPEMIIVKTRSVPGSPYDNWFTWTKDITEDKYLYLNATNAEITAPNPTFGPFGTYAQMTTTGWYVQNAGLIDRAGDTYVSYLFATCAGVSKVGSYTGNGSSQTINCGFTGGARLVLIKRTDSTGDWYVWDSARGIVAGNDPHLSLNTTAAEVTTDDSVDTDSTGFVVNQVAATNVNVNTATYIFLAIA